MRDAFRRGAERVLALEPWWAEFWSASTAVLWAGFSYAGAARLQDWPSMRLLLELGDERFWHLLVFGLGFCQIVSLACDRRWWRWAMALAQGWFWGVLTLGMWAATPWSPAVAVYAGWCVSNVFSVLRLLRPLRAGTGLRS